MKPKFSEMQKNMYVTELLKPFLTELFFAKIRSNP